MLLCCFRSWGLVQSESKALHCVPLISKSHCTPHLLRWKLFFLALGSWLFGRKVFRVSVIWLPGHWAECLSGHLHPGLQDSEICTSLATWNAEHKSVRKGCKVPALERWGCSLLPIYVREIHWGVAEPAFPTARICTPIRYLLNYMMCRVLESTGLFREMQKQYCRKIKSPDL